MSGKCIGEYVPIVHQISQNLCTKCVPNLTKLMKNDRIIIQKCKEKHAFMHIFLHKCVYLVDDQGLEPWAH